MKQLSPILLLVLLLCHRLPSRAQLLNQYQGAAAAGKAGISVHDQDVFATHHNPAGLASLKHWQAACALENRYFIRELNPWALLVAVPLSKGSALGAECSSLGWKAYREWLLGMSYGMQLGKKLRAGVRVRYHRSVVQQYPDRQFLTGDIGVQLQLNTSLLWSTSVFNPGFVKVALSGEPISPELRTGLQYRVSKQVGLFSEVSFQWERPSLLRLGLEYAPNQWLRLYGGFSTNPWCSAIGMGYCKGKMQWRISFQWNTELGISTFSSLHIGKP